MLRFNEIGRDRAIVLIMQGHLQSHVANQDDVHETTTPRLVGHLRARGWLGDRPRSRRPRVASRGQYIGIRLSYLCNVCAVREVVGPHGRRICPRTDYNQL